MNSIFYKIPLPISIKLLRKKVKINPLIVNYHVVSDKNLPYIKHLYRYKNRIQFIADLAFLLKYYEPITLEDFLAHIQSNSALPRNSVLFTIDDGLKEIYENIAPILIEKKVKPCVFLTSDYFDNKSLGYDHKKSLIIEKMLREKNPKDIKKLNDILNTSGMQVSQIKESVLGISYTDRLMVDAIGEMLKIDFQNFLELEKPYLDSNQVKALISEGFTIGGHSIDHPNFAELNLKEQLNQAISSVNFVSNQFDLNYKVFAFPYWDAFVSQEFFRQINSQVDATFGNQGIIKDSAENNFQRVAIENYKYSGEKIIKAHYLRNNVMKLLGRNSIVRANN